MATTLVEQIEEMRIHMHDVSRREQHLVNALGLALKRTDEKLLEAVRSVAVEHGLRREGIMNELHALAARMGSLPVSQRRAALRRRMHRSTCGVTRPVGVQATGLKQWPTFPIC